MHDKKRTNWDPLRQGLFWIRLRLPRRLRGKWGSGFDLPGRDDNGPGLRHKFLLRRFWRRLRQVPADGMLCAMYQRRGCVALPVDDETKAANALDQRPVL
jgi:hypothetical protein